MQNRTNTIEERLQIINDYIQRTMDALNATRQVVQGLSSSNVNQQSFVPNTTGISHSSFLGLPQFVQTPYGIVAVNAQTLPQLQQLSQLSQLSPFNYGVNYGLHHSSQFVPQFQAWPMNVSQFGIPQVLPQMGLNYGWQNGLNHTQFVPQIQSSFQMPIQNWPIQNTLGNTWGLNQVGLNQMGLNQVVPQNITGQTL